jgi:AraC-like DNA-binding protein
VDVCKNLKDNIITSHIPIILLSAKSAIEDQIKGFESGADAYVPKPFSIENLIANTESILLNRKKLREKLGSIEGRIGMKQSSGVKDKFITLIDNKILDHLSDVQFGVEELASEVGLSRSHLNRKLNAIANMGPNSYIRKIRMEKAAELLLDGELTISEISMDVGFNSISYFSRTFKSYYKLSPKAFIDKQIKE